MQKLSGIIPPMITPLSGQDKLDDAGLERLIEHILCGRVKGLFVLGSSGEAASLPEPLRKAVVTQTVRQVAGRVPVLVGITDTCLSDCLAAAQFAADRGAAAVVMAAPYYFPISQDDLYAFTLKIASASPLPVYVYNMPGCTKIVYEPETLRRLADCPSIAGVKDSSGDMNYFRRLVALTAIRPDWSILVGPETLLAEAILMGGHGGVCGGANIFPHLYQELYEAAAKKNVEQISRLQGLVMDLSETLYAEGYLPGVKHALQCLDICSGCVAEPMRRPSANRQQKIAAFLAAFEWRQTQGLHAETPRKVTAL